MPAIPKHARVLGEAIRKCRKKAKFSQEQLAERADLNYKYLGEIERGENTISLAALIRIAKALDVPLRKLVEKI